MAILKSYTCSKCGGILNFDSDQEFFDCPFCGNKFDIVDFHVDEIMSQAEESLKQEAFSSAKEKFFSILDKDPANFEALKGLILCELKLPALGNLSTPRVFDSVDVDSLKKLISMAKKQDPEDEEFFNKILILRDLSDKLKGFKYSSEALTSESTRNAVDTGLAKARQRRIEEAKDDFHFGYVFCIAGVIIGTLIICHDEDWIGLGVLIMMAGAIAAMVAEASHKEEVFKANPKRNAWEMKSQMDSEYNRYKKMYGTEFNKILEMNRTKKKERTETSNPVETANEPCVIDTEHQETVICSKCAAQLYLDKERRVYECKSCGVAYGISLFFGMPFEKALNSMNIGNYGDAEKRFENILMVEPSSFEALLGQILCVGRWSRVSDIAFTDVISEEDSPKFRSLFSDAKERLTEADKVFFEKFEELLAMLEKISTNSARLGELKKENEKLESDKRVRAMAEASTYGNWREMKNINDEIEQLEKDNRQLNHDFLALKRELVKMKLDCVLVK